MTDEETLRSDFEQFDADGNGFIDLGEFTSLLEFLHVDFSPPQTRLAFSAIDTDGSGRIEYEEFRSWWLKYQEED